MNNPVARIHILNEQLKNQIAAGEVVEGAFSVIKELVENSLDSDANSIAIEVENGGRSKILVSDNGHGIDPQDLPLAIQEHATSKISSLDDLFRISSMGFRGEALSSICSISHFCIRSRRSQDSHGHFISGQAGKISDSGHCAMAPGTQVSIENIFFNTPARRKFLRSPRSEIRLIRDIIYKMAIAFIHIHFKFKQDGKAALDLVPRKERLQRIGDCYDPELRDALIPLGDITDSVNTMVKISGFVSRPNYHRGSRQQQMAFVNNRAVNLNHLGYYLSQSFQQYLEKGRYPACFLFLELAANAVDVNVHPTKREVRFPNESDLGRNIMHSIRLALRSQDFSYLSSSLAESVVRHHSSKMAETDANDSPWMSAQPVQPTDQSDSWMDLSQRFANTNLKSNKPQQLKLKTEGIQQPIQFGEMQEAITPYGQLYSYTFLGQFSRKYLVFEQFNANDLGDKSLLLVDGHAAHERIQYEKLINKRLLSGHNITQKLLLPLSLNIGSDQIDLLEENLEHFNQAGITLEISSDKKQIHIDALPYYIPESQAHDIILDTLAVLLGEKDGDSDPQLESLRSRACRKSIRSGEEINRQQAQALINDLFACQEMTRCPHGRPTLIGLSIGQIDRMFQRIL